MTGRIEIIINGKINAVRDVTNWTQIEEHIDRWRISLIATLTTDDTYSIVAIIESDFKSKNRMRNERNNFTTN